MLHVKEKIEDEQRYSTVQDGEPLSRWKGSETDVARNGGERSTKTNRFRQATWRRSFSSNLHRSTMTNLRAAFWTHIDGFNNEPCAGWGYNDPTQLIFHID